MPLPADGRALRTLARVEQWAGTTRSGDLAEVAGLDERSPVIPLVTSTRDNCLGAECPDFRDCHVMKARREAMAADVVVVNHHLYFADVALRDTGMAELLPSVEVAVFDEAHQLAEAGVQFLGVTLGSAQLADFARDLLAAGLLHARGLQAWQSLAVACEQAGRGLRLAVAGDGAEPRGSFKLRWDERAGRAGFHAALEAIRAACEAAARALAACAATATDLDRLRERAAALADAAAGFAVPVAGARTRWIDLGPHHARLVDSPLDIREALRAQRETAPKAWVFTSATLGDDERLSWFTEPAGLDDATVVRVGSPFDYAAHARLYVPAGFPKPGEPEHAPSVGLLASRCARALGGRTFVLTTTLRALQAVGDALRAEFEAHGDDIDVLVQGSLPKRELLQRFVGGRPAVLVGSQSFWEGIDVPGEALQCVLIDKLPFPPPGDPLVQARVARLAAAGRNAFTDYFVAEAAVALKQGAGRLIRSETDRGLLVVCDPRLASGGYARRLRAALPPMTRLATQDEALAWLAELRAA